MDHQDYILAQQTSRNRWLEPWLLCVVILEQLWEQAGFSGLGTPRLGPPKQEGL